MSNFRGIPFCVEHELSKCLAKDEICVILRMEDNPANNYVYGYSLHDGEDYYINRHDILCRGFK